MEITRITPNNAGAFEDMRPAGLAARDDLLWFGAVDDRKTAASCIALEVIDAESVDIVWFYTEPSMREQGAATELLDSLSPFLREMGVERMEITFTDSSEDLDLFLPDHGFLIDTEQDVYSVPMDDLIYSARMDELLEVTGDPAGVTDATDDEKYAAMSELLAGYGIYTESTPDISRSLSRVAMNDEGEITGCILIREPDDEDLEITYFINTASNEKAVELVASLCLALRELDAIGARLVFSDPGRHSIRFVENLTEQSREDYRVDGIYHGVCLLS